MIDARRTALLALLPFLSLRISAQDSDLGRRIYTDCAKSVFVLYAQSPAGEYIAQGSGFLIAGNKIVTNEHVAHAGKIFVDLGSARIPATLQSVDAYNDVAILTVDIEMTVKSLTLADSIPSPGETIFAIGNPEGLERSISQGVVSGSRQMSGSAADNRIHFPWFFGRANR